MQVKDIMTRRVVSVPEDAPVRSAARLMAEHRISGLPVVDGAEYLVGVISEFDLISKPEAATIAEAMSRNLISVMEETDLDEVRFLLVERRIKRVPVVRGHKVVGIVSRADLVKEIALTWVCQVCGDHERGLEPPPVCPRCGVPSGYEPSSAPPVGEGSPVEPARPTCPTCGQPVPR